MWLNTVLVILSLSYGWASQCSLTNNMIIGEGSVKKISNIASADDCCSECFNYGYGCQSFTYQPSTKECFLKDNCKGKTSMNDRVSGTTSVNPPPDHPNSTVSTRACQPPHHLYDFCNTSLSLDERVANLIELLNDTEIPPLLTAREGGGGSPGPPGNISRLGIPEYTIIYIYIYINLFIFLYCKK